MKNKSEDALNYSASQFEKVTPEEQQLIEKISMSLSKIQFLQFKKELNGLYSLNEPCLDNLKGVEEYQIIGEDTQSTIIAKVQNVAKIVVDNIKILGQNSIQHEKLKFYVAEKIVSINAQQEKLEQEHKYMTLQIQKEIQNSTNHLKDQSIIAQANIQQQQSFQKSSKNSDMWLDVVSKLVEYCTTLQISQMQIQNQLQLQQQQMINPIKNSSTQDSQKIFQKMKQSEIQNLLTQKTNVSCGTEILTTNQQIQTLSKQCNSQNIQTDNIQDIDSNFCQDLEDLIINEEKLVNCSQQILQEAVFKIFDHHQQNNTNCQDDLNECKANLQKRIQEQHQLSNKKINTLNIINPQPMQQMNLQQNIQNQQEYAINHISTSSTSSVEPHFISTSVQNDFVSQLKNLRQRESERVSQKITRQTLNICNKPSILNKCLIQQEENKSKLYEQVQKSQSLKKNIQFSDMNMQILQNEVQKSPSQAVQNLCKSKKDFQMQNNQRRDTSATQNNKDELKYEQELPSDPRKYKNKNEYEEIQQERVPAGRGSKSTSVQQNLTYQEIYDNIESFEKYPQSNKYQIKENGNNQIPFNVNENFNETNSFINNVETQNILKYSQIQNDQQTDRNFTQRSFTQVNYNNTQQISILNEKSTNNPFCLENISMIDRQSVEGITPEVTINQQIEQLERVKDEDSHQYLHHENALQNSNINLQNRILEEETNEELNIDKINFQKFNSQKSKQISNNNNQKSININDHSYNDQKEISNSKQCEPQIDINTNNNPFIQRIVQYQQEQLDKLNAKQISHKNQNYNINNSSNISNECELISQNQKDLQGQRDINQEERLKKLREFKSDLALKKNLNITPSKSRRDSSISAISDNNQNNKVQQNLEKDSDFSNQNNQTQESKQIPDYDEKIFYDYLNSNKHQQQQNFSSQKKQNDVLKQNETNRTINSQDKSIQSEKNTERVYKSLKNDNLKYEEVNKSQKSISSLQKYQKEQKLEENINQIENNQKNELSLELVNQDQQKPQVFINEPKQISICDQILLEVQNQSNAKFLNNSYTSPNFQMFDKQKLQASATNDKSQEYQSIQNFIQQQQTKNHNSNHNIRNNNDNISINSNNNLVTDSSRHQLYDINKNEKPNDFLNFFGENFEYCNQQSNNQQIQLSSIHNKLERITLQGPPLRNSNSSFLQDYQSSQQSIYSSRQDDIRYSKPREKIFNSNNSSIQASKSGVASRSFFNFDQFGQGNHNFKICGSNNNSYIEQRNITNNNNNRLNSNISNENQLNFLQNNDQTNHIANRISKTEITQNSYDNLQLPFRQSLQQQYIQPSLRNLMNDPNMQKQRSSRSISSTNINQNISANEQPSQFYQELLQQQQKTMYESKSNNVQLNQSQMNRSRTSQGQRRKIFDSNDSQRSVDENRQTSKENTKRQLSMQYQTANLGVPSPNDQNFYSNNLESSRIQSLSINYSNQNINKPPQYQVNGRHLAPPASSRRDISAFGYNGSDQEVRETFKVQMDGSYNSNQNKENFAQAAMMKNDRSISRGVYHNTSQERMSQNSYKSKEPLQENSQNLSMISSKSQKQFYSISELSKITKLNKDKKKI